MPPCKLTPPRTPSAVRLITGGHFLGHPNICTVYFYAVFNRPFASYGVWNDAKLLKNEPMGQGKTAGAYIVFDPSSGSTILAKVAVSYVSVENAKANLEAESPPAKFSSADFDHAVQDAGRIWNSWLNRIQISGGTDDDRKTFYSMFYHALLAPTICSDANGEYLGYDGNVHKTENGRAQYGNFSGWDVYRSECQFLAMIAPKEAGDMAQSLLLDYRQGGAFPRWGLTTEDSGVMDGDPSAPLIVGTYAFGATNFDSKTALAGLVRAATDTSVQAPRTKIFERDGLADYLKLGYVTEEEHGIWNGYGNVSMTLEYDSADFAVSQFAHTLGDEADSALLLKHAQNWKNLYNPDTRYLQMRHRDGTWAPGFTNNVLEYDHNRAYQEGTAEQYIWMVPFNLKGVTDAIGGPAAASARLDTFFTQLNAGDKSTFAHLGNEPCLETPWIYCFLGQPYKAQQVVRRAINELYSSGPAGYPGNDDLGEMSSWYLFGALGMYPELPGSDVLVLGSPLFPKATLHLAHGDVTIKANGAENGPYIAESDGEWQTLEQTLDSVFRYFPRWQAGLQTWCKSKRQLGRQSHERAAFLSITCSSRREVAQTFLNGGAHRPRFLFSAPSRKTPDVPKSFEGSYQQCALWCGMRGAFRYAQGVLTPFGFPLHITRTVEAIKFTPIVYSGESI